MPSFLTNGVPEYPAIVCAPSAGTGYRTSRTFGLTNQTIDIRVRYMLHSQVVRLLEAYPAIYLACHGATSGTTSAVRSLQTPKFVYWRICTRLGR